MATSHELVHFPANLLHELYAALLPVDAAAAQKEGANEVTAACLDPLHENVNLRLLKVAIALWCRALPCSCCT
jgi:hypothetical protein